MLKAEHDKELLLIKAKILKKSFCQPLLSAWLRYLCFLRSSRIDTPAVLATGSAIFAVTME